MKDQNMQGGAAMHQPRRLVKGTALLAALALLPMVAGVASGVVLPPTQDGMRVPAKGQQSMADGLSDSQIVGIVLAADEIDIRYARIALGRSKDKAVREFAQRMITDHGAVQESVIKLARKLNVRASESPVSESLKEGAVDITAKLESLTGKEFDRFYIENEVSYHQAVTDAVEGVLIPSAKNAELRAALQGAQPLFLKHLEHARLILAENGRGMRESGK